MITELTIDRIKSGKNALVVGGSNGLGLAISKLLSQYCVVYVVDKVAPSIEMSHNVHYIALDLMADDYSVLDEVHDIDKLIITAGFGKLALFKDCSESLIKTMMNVNAVGVMRIVQRYYTQIHATNNFYTAIMVSIAGFMSSPFYAIYGASKAALKIFIESLNVELLKAGFSNRILNISAGSFKGTSFNGGCTDLYLLEPFAEDIITRTMNKDDLYIVQYDEIYKDVLERYHQDFRTEGIHSYEYKKQSGRI